VWCQENKRILNISENPQLSSSNDHEFLAIARVSPRKMATSMLKSVRKKNQRVEGGWDFLQHRNLPCNRTKEKDPRHPRGGPATDRHHGPKKKVKIVNQSTVAQKLQRKPTKTEETGEKYFSGKVDNHHHRA